MKLINVSVGAIHQVQIGSEVVATGHLKQPIAEPWRIDAQGVIGDRRAVHPDKIYAFARNAYDFWGERLGVAPDRWPDGFFGENLTLDELDEADVRVGDVFALGEEVRLFVAGARNPCHKLAWRMNQPLTFQKQFATSGHAGMYMGVEAGGVVRPGDRLRRIAHDPDMPSIAEVNRMIASPEAPPLGPLRRLLDFERLSPTNRIFLSAKLDAAERAAEVREGGWRGWRDFIVDRVVVETPDIRSVTLVPADGGLLCRARPGQFVTVELDGEGERVVRCWSLSAFDYDPRHYQISVRRQAGAGSLRLHALEEGARLRLRAPAGGFTLNTGSFRPIVLIAGGIGITPLKAMLEAHLQRADAPHIRLFYGGRSPDELAFREQLAALAAERDDFSLILAYSRATAPGAIEGRITAPAVIERLGDIRITVAGQKHLVPWFETEIYLCGPGGFCEGLKAGFVARGANPDRIFFESFTAAEVAESEVEQARVRFARSGTEAVWTAAANLSLLELAEAAGIVIPNSCRSGSCLTCRCKLLAGTATLDAGEGTTLPCIARPNCEALVLDV